MNDKTRMWLKLLALVAGTFLATLSGDLKTGRPLDIGSTLAALGAALMTLNAFLDKTVANIDTARVLQAAAEPLIKIPQG